MCSLRLIAKHNPLQKHLLVLARSVSYLDVAGAEMLARELRELRMRRAAGGRVCFHQVKDGPMEILRRGGYRDEIGEENFFQSKSEAIAHTTNLRKVGGSVMLAVPPTLLDLLKLGVGAKVDREGSAKQSSK